MDNIKKKVLDNYKYFGYITLKFKQKLNNMLYNTNLEREMYKETYRKLETYKIRFDLLKQIIIER